IEGMGVPPEQFDIAWKLRFLVNHPHHLFTTSLASLADFYWRWREAIGGLGWGDMHLSVVIYLVLSAAFLLSCVVRLELDWRTRLRVAVAAAACVLAYWLAIFLIFYLAWTPIDALWIHGIQGRYFTIVLPPAALVVAALVNRGAPEPIVASI